MTRATVRGPLMAGLLLWGAAYAQSPSEITPLRQEIAVQRGVAERTYTAAQVSCYQQFSVNDCLTKARQNRSAALGELKRQEVVLNDEDRKRKAAAQVRKIDEKTSTEAEQKAAEQRSQRADSAQRTLQRLEAKDVKTATVPDGSGNSVPQKTPTPRVRQAIEPKTHDSKEALKAFAQKQREAELHQADVEKNRQARAKPLATALPEMGVAPTPLPSQLVAPTPKGLTP